MCATVPGWPLHQAAAPMRGPQIAHMMVGLEPAVLAAHRPRTCWQA